MVLRRDPLPLRLPSPLLKPACLLAPAIHKEEPQRPKDQHPSTVRLILELSPLLDTLTIALQYDMTVDKPWILEALNRLRN